LTKNILLIITGSVAAYKSLDLIRLLKKADYHITPIMTKGAEEFITPLLVSSIAQEKVLDRLFSMEDESKIGHINLSRQNDVRIHLRVSDDGSYDKTVEIINSHKHLFETCIISSGPCLGPSANFFSLIEQATYEFVALADQDDIWLPHHLISAINRLSKTPDLPSMTFSTVAEFTEEKETETI
jgi:cellulose synthase/poly-beta-1,6-N-acetylglucosamine synthase-like glycosyltransferase